MDGNSGRRGAGRVDPSELDWRTPRLLDELAARATVSPIDRNFDGWHAKAAPDLPFRRCNAVLPPAGVSTGDLAGPVLEQLERWYGEMDQRVIVVVSSAEAGAGALDDHLAERGYLFEAPVHIMVRRLPIAGSDVAHHSLREAAAAGASPIDVTVTDGLDAVWADRYSAAHGGDEPARHRTRAYGQMLESISDRVLAASANIDGEPAAVGFGVLDAGWIGVFGMGTALPFRGRGVAGALARSLLERASERGASGAYLQVETDNDAAVSLYRRLGFQRSHGYHYRVSAARPR